MNMLNQITLNRISLRESAGPSSEAFGAGTVVLDPSQSWSVERKLRAVRASAARIAAQIGHFEECFSLITSLSPPLQWHEHALAGFALLKLGRAEESIA